MINVIKDSLKVVVISTFVSLSVYLVLAQGGWVEPTVAPPGGNAAAPLNTGSAGQSKSGGLILNTGGAANGLIVNQGNVGIGNTNPNQKLSVAGTIESTAGGFKFPDGTIQTTASLTSYTAIFNYTGGQQTFVVPSGLTAITVDVIGAKGGRGFYGGVWGAFGGNGGRVQGNISVTPGETLYLYVGGAGGNGDSGAGGFNGGGNGGAGGEAGGGGGSDIRRGGTALANRIVSAGGGGGGDYWSNNSGGAGGGLTGTAGSGSMGGQGGTQSAGGAGGTPSGCGVANAGSLGAGGSSNGPGGGGGYYGGGGGGSIDWGETCELGGGGGGSSLVPSGGSTTSGYQNGAGQIVLSYNL